MMILKSNVPEAERMFHLTALAIIMSSIAHSSTDVPICTLVRTERQTTYSIRGVTEHFFDVDPSDQEQYRRCDRSGQ
jgi:hypothetical protein